MLVLCYVSFSHDSSSSDSNFRFGMLAALSLFIFVSAVHLPDSAFLSRPHPVFWRMLLGLALAYLVLLTFLLFQSLDDARQLLRWLDPKLGKPLPDKMYADHCEIYTPEHPSSSFAYVKDCFLDVYVLAHAIGWWLKMIIIRDVKLCTFLSVFFEFLEISLKHQLPNFTECWWDSVVMDVILCNQGGILLGWVTCRMFEMREYYWGIGDDASTQAGRFSALSRSAKQLTPYSWSVYKWEVFTSSKNFVTTIWYVAFVNLVDLSNFYLKFVLWIPANHWILLYRLLFWAIFAVACTREYYEYVQSGFKLRLGVHCWIAHLLLLVEWLIVITNSAGMFNDPMPLWLQYTWTLIAGFLISAGMCLFYKDLAKKIDR
jgi:phosphatidylserine synthase 2